LEKEDFLIF